MRNKLLLLPAVAMLCAAASTSDYRALRNEPAPTWLPVPVAGVRASKLTDSWGDPRSGGRSHEGIDIMAKRGTPVVSATHGYISAVQFRENGGNTVSVEGPGGYRHYYAHLDSYGRYRQGDWVEVGDTLGFVGNTGNASATAPHLHYGIYTPQGAINPYPLLTAPKTAAATTPPKAETRTTTGSSTPVSTPRVEPDSTPHDGVYRSTARRSHHRGSRGEGEGTPASKSKKRSRRGR
jgi:peptidoglycan LD-endopeptidase LytH